jgi:hypothetical protein
MNIEILKAQYANDIFTTQAEAEVRSRDMGLGGAVHVSDYDGQAVFIPAESHEAYLAYYTPESASEPSETLPDDTDMRMEALECAIQAVIETILGKSMSKANVVGEILKVDDEQRIIYGWGSVVTEKGIPVVDLQGDVIEAETLVKAVNEFMEHVRIGKTMHEGEATGQVIHSLPVTDEICKALGIQCEREGWVVAYKVYDDEVWKRVKSGELKAFSIGGRATKEEYNIA